MEQELSIYSALKYTTFDKNFLISITQLKQFHNVNKVPQEIIKVCRLKIRVFKDTKLGLNEIANHWTSSALICPVIETNSHF